LSVIKLYKGDCLEILKTFPENFIDTCITDPPYELGFLGKKWDSTGISFQPTTWREVLRVLKPGATLLAFGAPKKYHRLACAIEDAGFEINDCISWVYGSGYPKNINLSKAIDKKFGAKRKVIGRAKKANDIIRRNRPKPNNKDWDRGCRYDDDWLDGTADITAPATPEAELWDGWGTQLKPAWEGIVVAQKPKDGTYVENALTWGVSGFWIDGGKVPPVIEGEEERYPADFIHDGSDEVLDRFDNEERMPSRFFYTAKPSKKEKNIGGVVNNHPSVKPIDLMAYLARLTRTPTRGVILDPFMGTGSSGLGAIKEGRDFIGIELDREYYKIAEKRIENGSNAL